MYSRETCVATLMTEVANLRPLADHLIKYPLDFTALTPLRECAEAIGSCASALRARELWRLSKKLLSVSRLDFSTLHGSAELKATVASIECAAVELQDMKQVNTDSTLSSREDPLALLDSTRWIKL